MKKKLNLYLVTTVVPIRGGVQESALIVLGHETYDAKLGFCQKLPRESLEYLSKNPEQIKVKQIPNEQLAFWCREVLGVRA